MKPTDSLRLKLIERLRAEGSEDLVGPMAQCGNEMTLVCTCCGEQKSVFVHCKRRWCPSCQPMVSAVRMERWGHAIEQMQWPLFITLTIPNSVDPESLRVLRSAWSRLRRRKLISSRIRGGVATFEITNKGSGWHPHIHAVADCRWLSLHVPEPLRTDPSVVVQEKCRLAQKELSSLWADVLQVDTAIVWVRRVKEVGSMAKEVMKYCMKGSDLVESVDPISPMLRVLKQTRTLSGWGSLHPLPCPDTEDSPAVECEKCHSQGAFLPAEVVSYITQAADNRSYQAPKS